MNNDQTKDNPPIQPSEENPPLDSQPEAVAPVNDASTNKSILNINELINPEPSSLESTSLESSQPPETPLPPVKNKLFVIHGLDEKMNAPMIEFLISLGLEPILMRDKENSAKPIAVKFTQYNDIDFALAILSGDDFVYRKENGKPQSSHLKADQGVVFELGFWLGKLGRDRVIAFYYDQKNFRCPTEFFDLRYVPFDKNGGWHWELVERLNQCNFKIDPKKLKK